MRSGLQLGIWLAAATIATAGEDLVVNGGLEQAAAKDARAPAGWSKPDGITYVWDRQGGNPGACARLDTSVLKVDKQKFLDAEKAGKAPPSGGGDGNQYDTVGAHEGAWAFAAPIAVAPDDQYFLIEVDIKGPRSTELFYPKVLLRGFRPVSAAAAGKDKSFFHTPHEGGPAYSELFGTEQRVSREGDLLQVWRSTLYCRLPREQEYQHFRMGVKLPKDKRYRPEVILLKCYAMWPLGVYRFDNLSFRRATKAEFDAAKAEGHSLEGFAPKP